MDIACGDKGMNSGACRFPNGAPSLVDIILGGSGKARNLNIATLLAMVRTESKSPGDEAGKPASITSTPNLSSCLAILSFSALFMLAPGDCSPSLNVVSKNITRSSIDASPYNEIQVKMNKNFF
jgi:hypothetical protein